MMTETAKLVLGPPDDLRDRKKVALHINKGTTSDCNNYTQISFLERFLPSSS